MSTVRGDVGIGLSLSILNRILGEGWRSGLMDLDIASLVGDALPLSTGIMVSAVGPELLDHFEPDAAVFLSSKANMQPTVELADPNTGRLTVQIGALEVRMSSTTSRGEPLTWATVEVSAEFSIQPTFANGEFALDAQLTTRVELVDSPLFAIDEDMLEDFFQAAIDGLAGGVLNDLVGDAVQFPQVELLGMGIGSVHYGSPGSHFGTLELGLELSVQP